MSKLIQTNALHLAITGLLSGVALTVAKSATVTHALTQWKAGQKTPVFQTLIAIDAVESGTVTPNKPSGPADRMVDRGYMQRGKAPASKGLTLDRIKGMACPAANVPALETLIALIEGVESGASPDSIAESWADIHKTSKAEHKEARAAEVLAARTEKQANAIATKAAISAAVKADKALQDAIALVTDSLKAGTLPLTAVAALRETLPINENMAKAVTQ